MAASDITDPITDRITDEALMMLVQEGSLNAFRQLHDRYSGRVMGYLAKRLSSREQAEDLAQQVFLKLHLSRDRFDPRLSFKKWIYTITDHTLIDSFRAQKTRPQINSEVDVQTLETAATTVNPFSAEAATDAPSIDSLSLNPAEAELLQMRYVDELEFDEIARRLDISQANVRQKISRTVRTLKARFQ